MGRTRTKYDKEFKMMAVHLCYTGKTATQAAMDLGIRPELVSGWKREYEATKKAAFRGMVEL